MAATPPILWQPDDARIERATITRYARWLAETSGVRTSGYHDLWRWSVDELEAFWSSIWDYFEVRSSQTYGSVLDSHALPGARWFPRARLNYAAHAYRHRDPDVVAIRHASELRPLRETTWGELGDATGRAAAALRAAGIGPGDRVVGYLPNIVEAVVAFHACASLGAVWSSCSPDFGVRSVVDRFAQIEPRILLAVDGYRYGGRDHDRLDVVKALQEAMPSLERTVVLGYLDPEPGLDGLANATRWDDFLAEGEDEALAFAQVAFDHPLWVLYSSGTTGLPKAIVHGHGGILLEHLKALRLHADLQREDRFFWFTTTGWMMWNFLVGGLLTDASIVLYDGNPGHPDLGALWGLAEEAGITCFGTSASFVAACVKDGVRPREGRDLSARRVARLDRVAAVAGGLRLGLRRARARSVAVLDLRRHRRLHGVRRRRADAPRPPGRAAGTSARREGGGVDAGGRVGRRTGRRAGDHRADAVHAHPPVGRRGRLPPARVLLRHSSPGSGGTATGSSSPIAARR